MKYFIDTEFLEGTQREKFPVSLFRKESKPTIDLISIGIVGEDGREYYAISKDFNLKEAWNRYDLKPDINNGGMKKVYWIRENVLYPIFLELAAKNNNEFIGYTFTYKLFEKLICKYGKTNKQIAEEIKSIFTADKVKHTGVFPNTFPKDVQFYGYYADYDWVAFCWLFGKMIDLPKGFPMYCIDLKQKLDDYFEANSKDNKMPYATNNGWVWVNSIKEFPDFPRQTNEHNALEDARWNKKLYEFLQTL